MSLTDVIFSFPLSKPIYLKTWYSYLLQIGDSHHFVSKLIPDKDPIRREEAAGAMEIVEGQARKRSQGQVDHSIEGGVDWEIVEKALL